MKLFRTVSAVVAATALASAALPGPVSAQTTAGVGTSLTSSKALTVQLGDNGQLLDLLLLGDEARATIDPAVASPEAYSRLTVIKAAAPLVPGSPVNIDQSLEAKSAGPTTRDIAPSNIVVPNGVTAALAPVLTGDVSAGQLTATVNNGVASAGLNAQVANVSAVGGLVSLQSLKSTLSSSSGGDAAAATRSASLNNLTVLDLGALLQGLGISLPDLTVAQLVGLVDALGASTGLPLPNGSATLGTAVNTLQGAINDLQGAVSGAPATTDAITGAIDSTTGTLLGTIGITSPLPTASDTTSDAVALVNAVIDQLQAQLNALLGQGLKALDNLALLRLEGVEVGVTTKATDTVAGSAASVTGKIGKVFVGNVELPGVDLLTGAAAVSAAVDSVNVKVAEVLAKVDPGLAGVVKVSVLDQVTSVNDVDGYVRSRAGITGATATITPPAALAAIVASIANQVDDLGSVLGTASVGALNLSSAMNTLASTLSLGATALSFPARVGVASVLGASDFARPATTTAAPVGAPTLPRTGGPDHLVILGGLAAVLALVVRRATRVPAVKAVRKE